MTICSVFTGRDAEFSKVFLCVGDVKLLFFVAVFPCLVCLAPDEDEDHNNEDSGRKQCSQGKSTAHSSNNN